ncbi:TNF receptor-associated factor 4-like [Dysidea avara]|uniref:TNF receptor-associated factor 4-like n=1 Tax=Dysidea avara TaxID=196820 RepID=UPI003327961E
MATPNDEIGARIGGYEYHFVDTPSDELICKICYCASREPHLSECCGYTFCRSCLDGTKKADRVIRRLHVFCTNKTEGCEWKGEINDVSKHIDYCQFKGVCCSKGCGQQLLRQYLSLHVTSECPNRNVNCQYCNITGEYRFIKGLHKEECVKVPAPCPNNCEVGNILREDINDHLKECPLEVIRCEYREVGCEERFLRKDQEKHDKEMMEKHLLFTKIKLASLQEKVNEIELASQKRIADLEHEFQQKLELFFGKQTMKHYENITTIASTSDQVLPVIVKMSDYANKRSKFIEWRSDSFYTHHMGYKMYLTVKAAGSYLCVALYLTIGPYDDHLKWPLGGNCTVKLLNQVSDSDHHSGPTSLSASIIGIFKSIVKVTNQDRLVWESNKFISNEDLHMVTSSHQYLKHDSIFLHVDYKQFCHVL